MLHNTQIKTNYFKQFRPLNFIQTLQVSPIDKQKQETTNPGRLLLPMTSFPLVPPETLDRHTCRRYRAIQSYKKFDYNNIAGKSSDFLCFHWEIANLLYTHTRRRALTRSPAVAEIADRTAAMAYMSELPNQFTSITILFHVRSIRNKMVTWSRERNIIDKEKFLNFGGGDFKGIEWV